MSNKQMNNLDNIAGFFNKDDEYFKQPVIFKDKDDHYELIYTGQFGSVGRDSVEVTKLMQDLKDGDKDKELHIMINSIGGDCDLLSMILQQVLQYNYRVTVCCGAALSAGFILWACGHEKYVSPYSELMYHTIYSGYEGKGIELTSYGNHIERLTEKMMNAVNMQELISEEDMQKGKSTEVWYTGQDFINSGKAKDYSEYMNRSIPLTVFITLAGNRFFAKSSNNSYVELFINGEQEYTYKDLLDINSQIQQEQESSSIEIDKTKVQSSSSSEEKSKKNNKKKSKKKLNVSENK